MNQNKHIDNSITVIVFCASVNDNISNILDNLIEQTIFCYLKIFIINQNLSHKNIKSIISYQEKYHNIDIATFAKSLNFYENINSVIRKNNSPYITAVTTEDKFSNCFLEFIQNSFSHNASPVAAFLGPSSTTINFDPSTSNINLSFSDLDTLSLLQLKFPPLFCMWKRSIHSDHDLYFNEHITNQSLFDFLLKASTYNNLTIITDPSLFFDKKACSTKFDTEELYKIRKKYLFSTLSQQTHADIKGYLHSCIYFIKHITERHISNQSSSVFYNELEFSFWKISSIFQFLRMSEDAKIYAREYLNIFNEGELITHQLKELAFTNIPDFFSFKGPLVSIVIPIYNCEQFIEETLNSISTQTHGNIELICIDDGSTDNSLDVAHNWIKNNFKRPFRIIKQNNLGPSRARNRGIQLSSGEFILALDADDQIAPHYLEKTLNAFHADPELSVVFTEAVFYGTENKIWATEDVRLPELFSRNFLNVTALFKKSAWREAGGYDEKLPGYEDWDLWITLASKGHRFKLIPEPLFFYRFRSDSRAANSEHKDAQKRMAIMRKHKDIYRLPNNDKRHLLGQFKRIDPQLIHPDWAYRTGLTSNESSTAVPTARPSAGTRKRILFVCHDFPPHIYAGAQLYALNLAKALNASGKAEVDVIYPEFWNDSQTCELIEDNFEGVRVFRLVKDSTYAFAPSVRHPQVAEIFDAFLQRNTYDLIHIHELGQMSAVPIEIAKKHGLPCIMTLHTTWLLCFYWFLTTPDQNCCTGPESIQKCTDCFMKFHNFKNEREEIERVVTQFMDFRLKYFKKMFSLLDSRIAPSRYMKEIYERFGFEDVLVRPLGMVPTNVPPKIEHPELRFGFIGQVSKRKGVNVLVDAFTQVGHRFPKVQLRIHGNQKDESFAALMWSKTKHLPGVRYFGPYTHHELGKIMSEIDVLVVPSYWENYPLVVQEALQHKVPVIASRVAGFPEMIHHGKNGLLFEVGNADDLASKMLRLCGNPEHVAEMRDNIVQVRDITCDRDDYLADYEQHISARQTVAGKV